MTGVQPPRGAVKVTTVDGRHTATCAACGWTYTNTVRSDVEQHKRWHRCPGPLDRVPTPEEP